MSDTAKKTFLDSFECSDQPLDLAFHPTKENLVAMALIDGTLEVHDIYQQDEDDDDSDDDGPDSILSSFALHTEMLPQKSADGEEKSKQASCRSVIFSNDGAHIYTGGSDGHLCAVDAERAGTFSTDGLDADRVLLWRIPDASSAKYVPIQTMHAMKSGPCQNMIAVGDESGAVRLWDVRQCGKGGRVDSSLAASQSKWPKGCVLSWQENTDYISEFDQSDDGNTLLATSADGRLSVFDLRMSKRYKPNEDMIRLSDNLDDELLSIKVIKNGKKVICGSHQGVLNVFSWGTWGDISDRFPGHPNSIDALLKVDEDTMLAGSSDGIVRVVSIHPDKLIGVLGEVPDGFPIEKMKFNAGRKIVASVSHDSVVRMWDATILDDSYDENDEVDEKLPSASYSASKPSTAAKAGSDSDDLEDEEDGSDLEDEDGSDSDDDSGAGPTANQKRAKRLKTSNEIFFADL